LTIAASPDIFSGSPQLLHHLRLAAASENIRDHGRSFLRV
jgi:hypothetical protein